MIEYKQYDNSHEAEVLNKFNRNVENDIKHDNSEKVVRIISIEYLQPEYAPFPLEKIKHIMRKK